MSSLALLIRWRFRSVPVPHYDVCLSSERAGVTRLAFVLFPFLIAASATQAAGQIVEAVGSRALGMGGAFVAVADDATATWWNPGALAEGPFVDLSLSRAVTESSRHRPVQRDRVSSFAIGTPPFGLSYYSVRVTAIPAADPTDGEDGDRQDEGGEAPVRSLGMSQFGITLVQSLTSGVHVGTTLKYVRGTLRSGAGDPGFSVADLLDRGDDLEGGDTGHRIDLDIGVLAAGGPMKAGLLVRNVREPEFETEDGSQTVRLPRQVRAGVAFDGARIDTIPLTLSFDADLRRYATPAGDRRVVAIGAEQWLFGKRLALRAGARFNRVGREERAVTGGLSVAVRSGVYLDGHLVRGGADDDRGWGMAARVSF